MCSSGVVEEHKIKILVSKTNLILFLLYRQSVQDLLDPWLLLVCQRIVTSQSSFWKRVMMTGTRIYLIYLLKHPKPKDRNSIGSISQNRKHRLVGHWKTKYLFIHFLVISIIFRLVLVVAWLFYCFVVAVIYCVSFTHCCCFKNIYICLNSEHNLNDKTIYVIKQHISEQNKVEGACM